MRFSRPYRYRTLSYCSRYVCKCHHLLQYSHFQYLLSEARIILISSHTSMLHLVSSALVELIYPFTWAGVYIPILPARLVQAIEAPCPYIVGLERRYENVDLPMDDFVLVDLEKDLIESTTPPPPMPKQQRRKLMSLLQVAAPHHYRFGVTPGPPGYGVESFPFDSFASENTSIFNSNPMPTSLSKYAGLNSSSFGDNNSGFAPRKPILNAFLQARPMKSHDRPSTTSTNSPPSSLSPTSGTFPSLTRNDSSNALQATLREKRSGHFDSFSRRSSSFNMERSPPLRRPSAPFSPPGSTGSGHASQPSVSTIATDTFGSNYAPSLYAPSSYAQSTLAASTIMPNVLMHSVRDTDTTKWVEGHCFIWSSKEEGNCAVCDERPDDGIYRCSGCGIFVHGRCAPQVVVVCSAAFHPEQIRAAFVRCFASLLYTYRKFLRPATSKQRKNGQILAFDGTGFVKSLPKENAAYVEMLQQTQGTNALCSCKPYANHA
jgi:DENN (AEX-3) domain